MTEIYYEVFFDPGKKCSRKTASCTDKWFEPQRRFKITKRDMEGKREERDKVKTGKQKRARRSGAVNSFI